MAWIHCTHLRARTYQFSLARWGFLVCFQSVAFNNWITACRIKKFHEIKQLRYVSPQHIYTNKRTNKQASKHIFSIFINNWRINFNDIGQKSLYTHMTMIWGENDKTENMTNKYWKIHKRKQLDFLFWFKRSFIVHSKLNGMRLLHLLKISCILSLHHGKPKVNTYFPNNLNRRCLRGSQMQAIYL